MYSNQDKYDFAIKDIKYSIGMSRGNALSKAVDLVIAGGVVGKSHEEVFKDIFEVADKFHHFNQVSIDKDFKLWLESNEKKLIIKALDDTDGNKTAAAEKLGISRRTLHRKLNEYGIN